VLGVSFDSVEENRAFSEKFSFPYPLLCDVNREMGMAYGACDTTDAGYAKRIAVMIDENGIVLHVDSSVDAASLPQTALGTF
jgi:peroxiredoxin Q/BCP